MNWGYRLLFVFLAFGAMIFYLVFRSFNTDFDLVEKEYYKTELRYQQVIEGTNRADNLSESISLDQNAGIIRLQLPEEMRSKEVTGIVWFYCAYNAGKDKKFELKPDKTGSQDFFIDAGNYTVKISWNADSKPYYTEKSLSVL